MLKMRQEKTDFLQEYIYLHTSIKVTQRQLHSISNAPPGLPIGLVGSEKKILKFLNKRQSFKSI